MKTPFWKKIQLEKRKQRIIKVGFLLLLLLLSVLVITILKVLVKNLTVPSESKKCWTEKMDMSRTNRVNIVFDIEPLLVFSFEKKEKEGTILLIPEDYYFKKGTEVYRLGSFFELGEMKDGCGGRFLKKTIEDFLAVPIDRYIKVRSGKWEALPAGRQVGSGKEVEVFVKKIQSWGWFFRFLGNYKKFGENFETDFSLLEIFRLWWQAKDLRWEKVAFQTLEGSSVVVEDKLPDGTKVKTVDQNLLPEKISKLFGDSQIEGEGIKIEVLNTTQKPGLGQKVGLVVNNLGGDLIHIGNWPEALKTTQIWVINKKVKDSYTCQRLAEVFGAEVFLKPEIEEARGDLLILLGEDYAKKILRY